MRSMSDTERIPVLCLTLLLVTVACASEADSAETQAQTSSRSTTSATGPIQFGEPFAAGAFVRPGGRLVYSTCSIEPDECGEIAEGIRRRDPRMRLAYEKLDLPDGAEDPTQWHDGGYVAVFEKS